jgi:dTDP-glucose pyrophosphorylase
LSEKGEKDITESIRLAALTGKAYGVLLKGTNININTPEELVQATRLVLKERGK